MTTADLEKALETGRTAYRSGDYAQAIATFQTLIQSASSAYRTKAAVGLVRTYMAQQDWPKAKALCQKISRSSAVSVQQWAADTLLKIDSHISPPEATQGTVIASAAPPAQNLSGFQPIQPAASIFHYAYLNGDNGDEPLAQAAVEAPIEAADDENALPDATPQSCDWSAAERLSKGRSLGKIKRGKLWAAQIAAGATLYGLLHYLIQGTVASANSYLRFLDRLLPLSIGQLPGLSGWLNGYLLAGLVGLVITSPWLWDLVLRLSAGRQAFSNQSLRMHSPEAATLLGTRCHQRNWPFPTLWKLPTEVPLIFSYGWLPRNARLVVSEGLLAQLEADEIAALVGYEIVHWRSGYWALLSAQGLLLQLFHQIYWQLALWGNKRPKKFSLAAGVLANLSYSVFWLMRLPALWVSRLRTYYGDRRATELTGNPNGLARALLKLSSGLAVSVEQQQYTPAIVERMALVLPVSADLARHRLYGHWPLSQLFAWDSLNPVRSWMSVSDPHPPLGDRLHLIAAYAQHWQLAHPALQTAAPTQRRKALSQREWSNLIAQGMPFFGMAFGLLVGIGLWLVGALADGLNQPALGWMYRDKGLLLCCLLMGAGIGNLLRINRFFPDLSFNMPPSDDLPQRLSDPNLLPISSLPTKLSGILIGRPGLANWLGQDLLLKTSSGLLKLHFFSIFGPLGNALPGQKPTALIGQSIQILGWFRRGHQPWLDIDKVRLSSQRSPQAAHPLFSLLLTAIAIGLGLWLLGLGQIMQAVSDKIAF
ncbi:MAG: M48 family metalloprotease [Phormidesmis sp.]